MDDTDAKIYPCEDCGKMRSKNEGGTVFTVWGRALTARVVCDECWGKHYNKLRESQNCRPVIEACATHNTRKNSESQECPLCKLDEVKEVHNRHHCELARKSVEALEKRDVEIEQLRSRLDSIRSLYRDAVKHGEKLGDFAGFLGAIGAVLDGTAERISNG